MNTVAGAPDEGRAQVGPGRTKQFVFWALVAGGFSLFVALGVWQLHRLAWKLDLIQTVNERVHAEPVDAPGPSAWPELSATGDAYRHIRVTGQFTGARPALAQAVTRLGPGFWVLEPFRTDRGFVVLVNRGFVTGDEARDLPQTSRAEVTMTGLLRMTEPGGGFLRKNDPGADRWYSRDVTAIATARGLDTVAPYFIDADASSERQDVPVGGLTVVSFRNHHLIYALTWFGLAAMLAGWTAFLLRERLK